VLEYLRHGDAGLVRQCGQGLALRREFEFYNLTWRPEEFEGWWRLPAASRQHGFLPFRLRPLCVDLRNWHVSAFIAHFIVRIPPPPL
jgi:hypothetical protein